MAAETAELVALGATLVGALAAVAKWLARDSAKARTEFLGALREEKVAGREDRKLDRDANERAHVVHAQTVQKLVDQHGEDRLRHEQTIMNLLGAKKTDTGSYGKAT